MIDLLCFWVLYAFLLVIWHGVEIEYWQTEHRYYRETFARVLELERAGE